MLTGLEIDIITESEEVERRQEEFKVRSAFFIKELDVEDIIAQLLVTEGYSTIEEIANQKTEELEKIEGFDSNLAQEISQRSNNYIKEQEQKNIKIIEDSKTEDDLRNFEGLNIKMVAKLAENKILTLDDFANLSTYELIDKQEGIFKDFDLDEKTVNNLIMKAREGWFVENNTDVNNSTDV